MAAVRHVGFVVTSYRTTHDLCLMVLKLSWNCTLIVFLFCKIAIFIFTQFSLKLPIHALFRVFCSGVYYPLNEFRCCCNPPKGPSLGENTSYSHKPWKSIQPGCADKKNTA